MGLRSERERHNRSEERLKRLNDRGIKLPWQRDMETVPENRGGRSIESGEGEGSRKNSHPS